MLKRLLPPSVKRPLRVAKIYGGRLRIWSEIARHIKGHAPRDRAILRRAIVRSPLSSLGKFDRWCDPVVADDCRVTSSLGTFHVRANSDDLYLTLPTREAAIVRTMRELLRPGDTFVDAGANIGVYTVFGASLGAKVIAVEMMPDTAAILSRHVRENRCSNVETVEAALSDVGGRKVTATVEPGKFGSASIAVDRGGRSIEVRTTTLRDVLAAVSSVRLLKLDLEGAEFAAINGTPLQKIEAIVFEDWSDDSVGQALATAGFRIQRIDGNNSLAVRPL